MDKDKKIKVVNRSRGVVGYTIPELGGLRRQFQHGEAKMITFEELEKLSWIPGGRYLLANELVVHDKEAVKELLGNVEPEYYYGEKEIRYLLDSGAPMDQLLDCLDFAPEGVLDLIKKLAVEMPCNDVRKREAIYDRIGFNVTRAIELSENDEDENAAAGQRTRRAAPVGDNAQPKAADNAPARRTSTYVVKK